MHSALNYSGGKSRLAKTISDMIPGDHLCYCEPFCGAAWVYMTKEPSKAEVLNDKDLELITFWRCIQNHLEEFLRYYKWAVVSRHLFELANKQNPSLLTDIQRSVRYYYLQRLAFGGKTDGRTFGASATGGSGLNLETMEDVLLSIHWRIKSTVIEHLDALECIRRYDRPTTVFYVDPPYYGTGQAYANRYATEDFARLRDVLAAIAGRFILSLNDLPEVRTLFKQFRFTPVRLRYSTSNPRSAPGSASKLSNEVIITNFKPMPKRPT